MKFVKWIAPIEIAFYFAVARVGEFVRDNASLGEIRKFEHNLKRRVKARLGHARVATDSDGSTVGYTLARPTFIKESYKIGPLFADSEVIAERLLRVVFEELLRQQDPAPVVCTDVPTEKASKLCETLQGKRLFGLVYMVTNDLPNARFDKWFGYTTIQFG